MENEIIKMLASQGVFATLPTKNTLNIEFIAIYTIVIDFYFSIETLTG